MRHSFIMRLVAFLAASAATVGLAGGIFVSDGDPVPGVWNSNLDRTLEAAGKEHRPMLLVHVSKGCSLCTRVNNVLGGEAFGRWQKDRKLMMAYRVSGSENDLRDKTRDFIVSQTGSNPGFPYVCLCWPKPDGTTNSVAFAGRRGDMCKDVKFKVFSVEFMTALDRALKDYLAQDPAHKTVDQIVEESTKTIAFETSGADGTVSMSPADGILPEGGRILLFAKPARGVVFMKWLDPEGRFAGWGTRLEVSGSMPGGKYKAVFRKPADCPPPILTNVSTAIFAQVKQKLDFTIPVSDECRPVGFRAVRGLPRGLKLDKIDGRITGALRDQKRHAFSIAVVGSDPAQTVKTFSISLMVQ